MLKKQSDRMILALMTRPWAEGKLCIIETVIRWPDTNGGPAFVVTRATGTSKRYFNFQKLDEEYLYKGRDEHRARWYVREAFLYYKDCGYVYRPALSHVPEWGADWSSPYVVDYGTKTVVSIDNGTTANLFDMELLARKLKATLDEKAQAAYLASPPIIPDQADSYQQWDSALVKSALDVELPNNIAIGNPEPDEKRSKPTPRKRRRRRGHRGKIEVD